jgi:hypothetical protein
VAIVSAMAKIRSACRRGPVFGLMLRGADIL